MDERQYGNHYAVWSEILAALGHYTADCSFARAMEEATTELLGDPKLGDHRL
jgi:hypothetical protein